MRTLVVGDIHGANKALVQCLDRCNFSDEDVLISLGDIADGWSQVPECVETLLGIKNLIAIRGNHDQWALDWLLFRVANKMWLDQGGQSTYDAYTIYHPDKMIEHEKNFFSKQHYYYHDKDTNRVFVHGGYVSHEGIGHDEPTDYLWDRELWSIAMSGKNVVKNVLSGGKIPRRLRPHKEIFIGHTTTMMWQKDTPMNACNVWNLDTGAGFHGRLTIMDVDTKEYWQSDPVEELYPEEEGRRKAHQKKMKIKQKRRL